MNEEYLLSRALSAIALEGKAVEVDHGMVEFMGLSPDPAMSSEMNTTDKG